MGALMIKNTWDTSSGLWVAHNHHNHGGNAQHYYSLLHEQGLLQGRSSVLSILGGTGHLESILAKKHGFSVGYIDPSPTLSQLFQKRFQEEGLEQKIVEFHPAPFETFSSNRQYDLIIAIHSWHHIGHQASELQKALQLLSPQGLLLLSINSQQAFTVRLRKAFPLIDPTVTAEDLSRWATELGYPHSYIESHKNRDIFQLIDRKGFTKQGKAWLSDVFCQEYENFTEETKQSMYQFFIQAKTQKTDWEVFGSLLFDKKHLVAAHHLEINLPAPHQEEN